MSRTGERRLGSRVTTKVVTKRLKSGETRRYRYYQEVATFRVGKQVKSRYVRYIGKLPSHVAANQKEG